MDALILGRRDERGQIVATGGGRHHRGALGALADDQVIEHDVLDGVDDLALQLVADDLVDLARIGERQLQHAQGQLVAGHRQVGRDLARHLRQPLAHGVHLPLEQRRLAGADRRLHQAAQRVGAKAHLEKGELDRKRADVDAADGVGHCLCAYSSRQYWRTPAAISDSGLIVSGFST